LYIKTTINAVALIMSVKKGIDSHTMFMRMAKQLSVAYVNKIQNMSLHTLKEIDKISKIIRVVMKTHY